MPKGGNQTKRKTIEYIKEEVRKIAPNTEVLSSEYENNRTKLLFKCECGKVFQKTWDTIHAQHTCRCRSCARKDGWLNKRRSPMFNEECVRIFNMHGLVPLEEITSVRQKVLCRDKRGYIGRISVENVRLNKRFSVFSVMFNEENLLHNLNVCAQINGYKTFVLAYHHNSTRSPEVLIDCICECGEPFTTCIGNFTTQDKMRCGVCTKKQSNIEHLVEIELRSYGVIFEPQKRFINCRNPATNYMLSFDFYVPSMNLCIEVDGAQHYKPSGFRNITKEEREAKLTDVRCRDEIKTNFCKNNGIKLLRIPYSAFRRHKNNYKEILKEVFKRS